MPSLPALLLLAAAQDPRALLEAGDAEAASRAARALLAKTPGDGDLLYVLAAAQARLGDLGEAAETCREALGSSPAHHDALMLSGELALSAQRFRDALDAFSRAEGLERESPRAALGGALALYGLVLYDEADRAFERAAALRAGDATPARYRALLAYERGDLAAAESRFRDALTRDPTDAESHFGLALCLEKKEDPGARAELEAALAADSLHLGAHLHLGRAALREGRVEEGRRLLARHARLVSLYDRFAFLRDSLRLDPRNAANRILLGRAYLQAGFPRPAAAEFREALRLRPGTVLALLGAGEALLASGDAEGAEKCLRTALAKEPENATARRLLAAALDALGRGEEAMSLREASDDRPR